MKIPRYWKQVFKHVEDIKFDHILEYRLNNDKADIYAWGYSDSSQEEALENANMRIDEIVKALSSELDKNFYYPLNVLREDILEEIEFEADNRAIISRNRYHAQILNTENMMFVDIDIPTWDIKSASFFQRLFGKTKQVEENNTQEIKKRYDNAIKKIEDYLLNDSEMGFRVYRTFAGLRLIATHTIYDPKSEETQQVFDALGADPLYQKLCKAQDCFRARLTPKFWRMDKALGATPRIKYKVTKEMLHKWTKEDELRVKEYEEWIKQYESEHHSHATCHFICHVGNPTILTDIEPLIKLHDEITKSRSGKSLA